MINHGEVADIDKSPILEFPFLSTLCRSLIVSLSSAQYRYCLRHPETTLVALEGLGASITECEQQMSGYRWNCSGFRAGFDATKHRFISRSPFDHPIAQKGNPVFQLYHKLTKPRNDLTESRSRSRDVFRTSRSRLVSWSRLGLGSWHATFRLNLRRNDELARSGRSSLCIHILFCKLYFITKWYIDTNITYNKQKITEKKRFMTLQGRMRLRELLTAHTEN